MAETQEVAAVKKTGLKVRNKISWKINRELLRDESTSNSNEQFKCIGSYYYYLVLISKCSR